MLPRNHHRLVGIKKALPKEASTESTEACPQRGANRHRSESAIFIPHPRDEDEEESKDSHPSALFAAIAASFVSLILFLNNRS